MSDQTQTVGTEKLDLHTVETRFPELAGSTGGFDELVRWILRYQRSNCAVYDRFCSTLGSPVDAIEYLPIEAFKLAPVTSFRPDLADEVFFSSGTSGGDRSRHFVKKRSIYERSIARSYKRTFGGGRAVIVGYLPGYTDPRRESSLAFMVRYLADRFGCGPSGIAALDADLVQSAVEYARESGETMILFGAAFGLLSLAEESTIVLPAGSTVVETGGMKTHRAEITRDRLHEALAAGFRIPRDRIWSEYGMTEMLSQAYACGDEWYSPPPWLRVTIVDPQDPSVVRPDGEPGAIAVVDLANLYSVSAILTQDLGVGREEKFAVLGRLPNANLRGCNFLLDDRDF